VKILISIVSYREKELLHTVKSFYEDAANKDSLLFSIVSQDDEHPDLSFIDPKCLNYTQIHWKDTFGVGWARHIAQKAFSDFDYYLQLDSHMFSEKNWDIKLIDSFNKAKLLCENPVLTCYPAMYRIEEDKRIVGPVTTNGCSDVAHLTWSQGTWPYQRDNFTDVSISTYINAAVVFSNKSFVDAVPYDPDLTFFHEEICLTLRLEAAGFTSVCISSPIFYHFFSPDRKKANRNYNPIMENGLIEHTNMDSIYNRAYSKKVLSGESTGPYAISKDTIEAFCKKNDFTIKP
jgi:GT2 family glycosyltransferase